MVATLLITESDARRKLADADCYLDSYIRGYPEIREEDWQEARRHLRDARDCLIGKHWLAVFRNAEKIIAEVDKVVRNSISHQTPRSRKKLKKQRGEPRVPKRRSHGPGRHSGRRH